MDEPNLVRLWPNKKKKTKKKIARPLSFSYKSGQFLSTIFLNFNRRRNELRHFAQNWAFYILLTSKGGNLGFPPPSPQCRVVLMFEVPIENNEHPNFEWGGGGTGEGRGFFCSLKLPYLCTMYQQFCHRLLVLFSLHVSIMYR